MSERCLEVTLTLSGAEGCRFLFERSPILVGRGASCELCVPLRSVSAQHLALSWTDSKLTARDLNAKNKAEHKGEPLTAEVSHPARLTLSLPGARLEARLVPPRARATSQPERNHHLRSLWSAADGWLLEWYGGDKGHETSGVKEPLHLIPLPFGERLALRAERAQAEGLPASLLELDLAIESAEWGLTITEPSGAQHQLRAGEEVMTTSGRLSLPAPNQHDEREAPLLTWRTATLLLITLLGVTGLLWALL